MTSATVPAPAKPTTVDLATWLVGASWVLLLVALFTPVLADNPGWFGVMRPMFRSGPYLIHAFGSQILVGGSLGCLAASLWLREKPLRWHPALLLVFGLLTWTFITTVLSPSMPSAILGLSTNSQGFLSRIVATTVLLLAVEVVDRSSRTRMTARVLGLVGGAVAVSGLLQVATINPLGLAAPLRWGRSFGTLANPDMFGGFVVLALFVSLGVALSETDKVWRWVMGTSAGLCAIAGFTSYSRAAWVGMFVGAAAFAFIAWRAKLQVDWRLWRSIMIVGLTITAVIALHPKEPGSSSDVPHRIMSAFSMTDPDSAVRLEIWGTAFRAIQRRPFIGYGPDTMVLATGPVRSVRTLIANPKIVIESAHNIVIQTLSDLGIPGLLLWAGMLVSIAVVSYRTITGGPDGASQCRLILIGLWAACAGYLADAMFSPTSVAGTLYLFCILGLLLSPAATGTFLRSRLGRRALSGFLGPLMVAGMIVAGCFIAADLYAASALLRSVGAARRIEAADRAVRLNPLSADYSFIRGSVLVDEVEQLGHGAGDPVRARRLYEQALAEARRTVALEPTNQRRRAFLADVMLAGARNLDKKLLTPALAEFGRAVMMAPEDLQVRYVYADSVGPERARPILEAILRLRPGSAEAAKELAKLHMTSGDVPGAKRVLTEALAVAPTEVERQTLEAALKGAP